jgi:uncharacterized protein (DUF58 family)
MKKNNLNVDLIPAIKRLDFATKKIIMSRIIGRFSSIFRGRGLEFSGYREYTTNDDAELIDWKASARTNKTLIREYVEEKNQDVFFLIDSSHNMLFGSGKKLKIEYAVEVIASIANAVLEEGNNVGFALFDGEIRKKAFPSRGVKQYYFIMQELIKGENYGGEGNDLTNAMKFAMNFLDEGSVLIIVSDFSYCTPGWMDYVRMASRKFDLIAMMVKDPRDRILPRNVGQVVMQDPLSRRQVIFDPNLIGDIYEQVVKEQEKEIEDTFVRANAKFVNLSTDKDFVKPVVNLFLENTPKTR